MLIHQRRPFDRSQGPEKEVRMLGACHGPARYKAINRFAQPLKRYESLNPVCIHGGMNGAAKQRSVKAFRKDPAVRLMIANPAAAREGLTLTEANTAIYVDRTFNLVDFLQSQDRIHRLSQTRPCSIIILMAAGTIDEFVDFSLDQKHRLARYAQNDVEDITTEDLALEKPQLLRALVEQALLL